MDGLYSFNQTIFWFVDKYLFHHKKLNIENYAAALYDFFHHPRREKMIVNPINNDVSKSQQQAISESISLSREPQSCEEVYYICKYSSHFNAKRYAGKLWGFYDFDVISAAIFNELEYYVFD